MKNEGGRETLAAFNSWLLVAHDEKERNISCPFHEAWNILSSETNFWDSLCDSFARAQISWNLVFVSVRGRASARVHALVSTMENV